jgi:DNA helicase HerA-like ATPase
MTILGEDPDRDVRFSIPTAERMHTLMIGGTGTGKTVLLESLILQDLRKGTGFSIIDAHGDLATKVMSHIPPDRWEDIVYINLLTADRMERVV